MIIYVDIDKTICTADPNGNYRKALPIQANIDSINELYEDGNDIIYWTARGTITKVDWRSVTENQLEKWKVKYHKLIFGKPYYDLWIDDKCINIKDLQEGICHD